MTAGCLICDRIAEIIKGTNRYFVKELQTGYVVIGDYQFYKGYTLFLSKKHVTELHELDPEYRKEFLFEMSIVAEAVFNAFKPQKLNYELLGNGDPHMHWHLFPRRETDPEPNKPVWALAKELRQNEKTRVKDEELIELKKLLLNQLENLVTGK